MKLIVAVYDNWGIGAEGTQPVALHADRKFFRETTRGATVIVGRRTVEDFPGQKPLPGRVNIMLTRSVKEMPGFTVCETVQEAVKLAQEAQSAFVIGGGSIYKQLLPFCDAAYVTKVHCKPQSDTYFPNLDTASDWKLEQILERGEESGVAYEICLYHRVKNENQ